MHDIKVGAKLAPREVKLMQLICEEALSYKEIAFRMNLTIVTARAYGAGVFKKLGCHTTLELAVRYWQRKLAELS